MEASSAHLLCALTARAKSSSKSDQQSRRWQCLPTGPAMASSALPLASASMMSVSVPLKYSMIRSGKCRFNVARGPESSVMGIVCESASVRTVRGPLRFSRARTSASIALSWHCLRHGSIRRPSSVRWVWVPLAAQEFATQFLLQPADRARHSRLAYAAVLRGPSEIHRFRNGQKIADGTHLHWLCQPGI